MLTRPRWRAPAEANICSFHYAELFHDTEHKKSWLRGWKPCFSRYYRMAGERPSEGGTDHAQDGHQHVLRRLQP